MLAIEGVACIPLNQTEDLKARCENYSVFPAIEFAQKPCLSFSSFDVGPHALKVSLSKYVQ